MAIDSDTTFTSQSALIKAMRFPLIVLVLFEHSVGVFAGVNTTYGFISEMISHHICPIAVCLFFFLSGYLFFLNLEEGAFSSRWILSKWKRRIRTLLIPYLIWNALMVLAILLKNYGFSLVGMQVNPDEMQTVHQGIVYWFITGPADFPLWFLLDMMVMSLITPLLYPLYKKYPWIALVILILLYLSPWTPRILSIRAIFFFSLGAWMSINHISFLSISRKTRIPAAIAAVILLILATAFMEKPLHEWLLRAFYPLGMITFLNICDRLTRNHKNQERLVRLSASVFFIYAAHEIYILGWTKGLLLRLFGESQTGIWIRYWMVPVIVLAVCLVLYQLLNRLMPRTLAFICGGRTTIDKKQ
ncbi:MAG: acyltransferase [Bacteroidales bacterium]|nr:acyltransferase [Bacteroidales bacterium]